jgi:hypothetical protein
VVEGKGGELLLSLVRRPTLCGRRCDLVETVGYEEDEIDQDSVGRALYFKVAEETVGTEEVEGLGDDVGHRGIRWRCERVCAVLASTQILHSNADNELTCWWCWSAQPRVDRQDGHVAHLLHVRGIVPLAVICLAAFVSARTPPKTPKPSLPAWWSLDDLRRLLHPFVSSLTNRLRVSFATRPAFNSHVIMTGTLRLAVDAGAIYLAFLTWALLQERREDFFSYPSLSTIRKLTFLNKQSGPLHTQTPLAGSLASSDLCSSSWLCSRP